MSTAEGNASGAGLRVRVWNEHVHEQQDARVAELYPDGMHEVIAAALQQLLPGAEITTATLQQPEQGLSQAELDATDVLLWWGHVAHDEVPDAVARRVQEQVLAGMGLVVLHSGHFSKPFRFLMGTTCSLQWRNTGERELVWTATPSHPITDGVDAPLVIPDQEMYGEPFDVPQPDDVVFISSFAGGEVFRSGLTWSRGRGRVFYFSPGDQDFPVYHHPGVQRVLANGARWAAPRGPRALPEVGNPHGGWFQAQPPG